MSVQIIVTSPFSYYKNYISNVFSKLNTWRFCRTIKKKHNISLNSSYTETEYYCEDTFPSLEVNFWEWLSKNKIKTKGIKQDLFLPQKFTEDLILKLPNLIQGTQKYRVGSSHELYQTCSNLENIINSQAPEDKKEDYLCVIQLYKEAASTSIKQNEPIFFSY